MNKQIKIVATLGPASHSEEMILEFAKASVDIYRINLSHATISEIAERVEWIRGAQKKQKKHLEILGDLPGAKIRIGDMLPNVVLEQGQKFKISKELKSGDQNGCGINHPEILDSIVPGAEVFIDDGNIKLVVIQNSPKFVETVVRSGGPLKSRKGFSAVGISLGHLEVSAMDKNAILIMIGHGVDMIAVSFVETEKDIMEVKKLLPKNSKIKIIAKIETIQGVKNAKKILEVSDGLMIARGDLGLAVPLVQVPHIQKELIKLCNQKGKFVITATQMLESMIVKSMPTRAEVSDVANAVLDGTDAVMLSGESAEGNYPLETVEMMKGIIDEALKHV
ncbi:MAG TPA: pyruvate kinase [Candidatus Limnocylindrales bacterium]|nr:pyruvate kinase [Candidatus Limnocylindrales bacterium]